MKAIRLIICDYNKNYNLIIKNDIYFKNYHIYLRDDNWYLECLDGSKFKDGTRLKKLVEDYYETVLKDAFYTVSLFLYYEEIKDDYKKYHNHQVLISSFPKANLETYDNHLKDKYIFIKDHKLVSNFEYIYVNHKRYNKDILNNNDLIEILGLKIIYNDRFLVINNFMLKNKLELLDIKNMKYDDYQEKFYLVNHRYQAKINKPSFKYEIDLKEYYHEVNDSFVIGFLQSFLMSLGMFMIAFINVYLGFMNNRSYLELLPIVLMPTIMAISTLIFPLINRFYTKHKAHQKEKRIQNENQIKINDLETKVKNDFDLAYKYHNLYRFDINKISRMFNEESFYHHSKKDEDYLYLHLGYGNLDTLIDIRMINGKNYHYNLKKINDLSNKYKYLKNTEVILDLKKYKYLLFKASDEEILKIFELVLLELVTLNSELKIALYINLDIYNELPYIKSINALYDGNKRRIYFNESEIPSADEDIILFTFDNLKNNFKLGSYIVLHFTSLNVYPKTSEVIIDIKNNEAHLLENGSNFKFTYNDYQYDYSSIYYHLRKYLLFDKEISHIKNTLYDYYPREIDLKENYNLLHKGIEVMFGINEDNQAIIHDISDKGIGPHAIISGTTGSGKSVHILSLILSLALNYPADKLNIILIDYKGSGLIDSLSYKGQILPHISTYLTNLDQKIFDRSIIGLKKECERRENLFRKLALITKGSIMCLDDYHKLYKDSYGLEYIPYQIIIIDEFAELKKEKPEFMKDIISIARIGRSLGIHLLLITQKPSAVVDQEIWANTSYKIALKAQSEADSKEMLDNQLATDIKKAGEFYLKYDSNLEHGFTLNSRAYLDERNESFAAILNYDLSYAYSNYFKTEDKSHQLDNYLKQIIDYHLDNHIIAKSLYLKPLSFKTSKDLMNKYNIKIKDNQFLIGEYDDYLYLRQDILIHDLNLEPYCLFHYKDLNKRQLMINNILESLLSLKQKIVYIHNHECLKEYIQYGVEYISVDNLDDIIYLINEVMSENLKVNIIIEDYEALIREDIISDEVDRLFENIYQTKIHLIIFIRKNNSLNYKYRDYFKSYVLDYLDKEELMMIFNRYNNISEEMVFNYQNKRLVGFKMAKVINDIKYRNNSSIIRKIPEDIKLMHDKYYIMLGYNLINRKKILIRKDSRILITSFYKEILNVYKDKIQLDDGCFKVYQDLDNNNLYDVIIWIGPNINRQYLFIANFKNDLKINEGYLYLREKKGIKFRF